MNRNLSSLILVPTLRVGTQNELWCRRPACICGPEAHTTILGIALTLLCLAAGAKAQSPDARPEKGARLALIVCGHPGDEEHRKSYAQMVEDLRAALIKRHRFSPNDIHVQFGAEASKTDGPALAAARGKATREDLAAEAAGLRKRLTPDDTLWVILLGHAHFDGRQAFLNLPGPDLRADEFGKLFAGFPAGQQVFFLTTSVSGFFLKPLSAAGRIVVTATEADLEINETLFPLALARVLGQSLDPPQFDVDHDGAVSVFDLYIAVVRDVADRYQEAKSIPTEHAQLDDNGDGRSSEVQIDYLPPDQGGRPAGASRPNALADGVLAARTRLARDR